MVVVSITNLLKEETSTSKSETKKCTEDFGIVQELDPVTAKIFWGVREKTPRECIKPEVYSPPSA